MATYGLAALLVLAYAAVAIAGGAWWDVSADTLLRLGGAHAPAIAAGEAWRLVTAIFLHGGLLHLAFNLIALVDFGSVLERRFGALRVLAVFFASGMSGFMASAAWHPGDVSIGASGAIFGLLGWWAVAAWRLGEFLPEPERRRRLTTLLTVVGVALGLGFVIPGIDNAAHLGGLLTGLALGELAMRRIRLLPLAATAIGGIVLAATLALPDGLAEAYRESKDFAARYSRFAQEDRAINQALLKLVEDSRSGRLSDAAGLKRLELDLIPRLARLSSELAGRPYRDPPVDATRARWARYAALRLEAVEGIRDAITGRRDDGIQVFEKKLSEAAAIARDATPR